MMIEFGSKVSMLILDDVRLFFDWQNLSQKHTG
jgi:hypothetical protein